MRVFSWSQSDEGGGKKLGPQEDMRLNPLCGSTRLSALTEAFKILWVRSLQVVTPT
jgi:hypothetical protein